MYNGDCLDVLKQIPDSSIDLVVTDPPYKTITGGDSNGKNSIRPKGMLSGNRKLFKHQNNTTPEEWLPLLYSKLKENTHCYIFTNSLNLNYILTEAEKCGFKLHNILVVLDPFIGSGSTGIACIEENRKFICVEIDEQYFKIAEERMKTRYREVNLNKNN